MKRSNLVIIGILLLVSGSVGALVISKIWFSNSHSGARPAVGTSPNIPVTSPNVGFQAPAATVGSIAANLTPPVHIHKDNGTSRVVDLLGTDSPIESDSFGVPSEQVLDYVPSDIEPDLRHIEGYSEYVENPEKGSEPMVGVVQKLFPDLNIRLTDPFYSPVANGYFYCDPCYITVPISTVPESSYSLIAGLVLLMIWRIAYKH